MRTTFIIFLLFLCFSIQSQNRNISNGFIFDGEPYLAINPENSSHLVVAWMSFVNFQEQFVIKIKTSFDGGASWSSASKLPHTLSGYTSADPSIDFDADGNVYACYIDFTGTTPPVTGGVYLCRSTDGGITWESPQEVIHTNYDAPKWPIDRPWIAIDRSANPTQNTIYVTTMNLNRELPPYNPYLSVSTDFGNSFTQRYLDTADWLAGNFIPTPMCSPTVNSDGVFFGAYPSYVLTQSLFPQSILVTSSDQGQTLQHQTLQSNITSFSEEEAFAKKASLLSSDPSDPNHLLVVFLSKTHGDLDVFYIETYDAGTTWTAPKRINDDPIANDRMQDLIWADFDQDGDIVVSWRDRRNGADSTYQASSEIWAAFRESGADDFSSNFQITNQLITHDTVLEASGNDFMCIRLANDTLNATWGDPRNGRLNIWFQKMTVDGVVVATHQLSSEVISAVQVYPNPTANMVTVEGSFEDVRLFDLSGNTLKLNKKHAYKKLELDISALPAAVYLLKVETPQGQLIKKIVKE